MYVNDEQNWIVSCKYLYRDEVARYKDMWDDYYSGLM
jgi:hypothetical protein